MVCVIVQCYRYGGTYEVVMFSNKYDGNSQVGGRDVIACDEDF